MKPSISVVIPVHNQASRLRATLATLENQQGVNQGEFEVVVVDDGSTDGAFDLVSDLQRRGPYEAIALKSWSGGCRGIPRNIGAQTARGDLLIFLDADACVSPGFIMAHAAMHAESGQVVLGDLYVVEDTEYLANPLDGTFFRGVTDSMLSRRRGRPLRLDLEKLREDSRTVLAAHAKKGAYPGMAIWQKELELMLTAGETALSFVGCIPHNLSVRRDTFIRIGGFDSFMAHLEGWDFGIKALNTGCRIGWAQGAKTFHLYHWRRSDRQRQQFERGQSMLVDRYPDWPVRAALLWSFSQFGKDSIPPELNLNNWRTVLRLYRDLETREWLNHLFEHVRSSEDRKEAAFYRYYHRAINPPEVDVSL